MQGIDLRTMSAPDLLDVLHYLFEEDNTYSSEAEMHSRGELRRVVYEEMYGQTYKYPIPTSSSSPTTTLPDFLQEEEAVDNPTPFNPKEQHKPFIPPTTFNPASAKPFGDLLAPPEK